MNEIWKDVPEYEGFYQISNLGNVKNIKTNQIKKSYYNNGYLRTDLYKDKKIKRYYIHRLIAITFLGLDCDSKMQVDHIDNNRLNNNLNNLQILSQKDNLKKQMINMKNNMKKYQNNVIKRMIIGGSK